MKRFFTLIAIVLGCITFSSCEKDVDPSKVEFEVAIVNGSSTAYSDLYTYNCYGSLGGFIGNATIAINDRNEYDVNVTGAKTPYSFTFKAGSKRNGYRPSSFNVKVIVNKKTVMETVVVPR